MDGRNVIVVAGGDAPPHTLPGRLPVAATVIAADGGVDRALALGLDVDIAIGDFDSISKEGLATAEAGGARVERHPVAKDATDLELALDAAIALGPARIVVIGSSGGRFDHLLGSVLLLGDEKYASAEVDAYLGSSLLHVVRNSRRLQGAPGDLVSLLPLHGSVHGVVTEGLEYPLRGETLPVGTSRGTSNVFAAAEARISVDSGCLLVVRPGSDGREPA